MNDVDRRDLSKQNSGCHLFQILLNAASERTRGELLVSRFFLALLDLFHDIQDDWAHYTAFHVVRETGRYGYIIRLLYNHFQLRMYILHVVIFNLVKILAEFIFMIFLS